MEITVNIYYTGEGNNAIKFASEMNSSGIVDEIRSKKGNLQYEYFISNENNSKILLIDKWENQEALDKHHQSDIMDKIIKLREKYNLSMKVERYITDEEGIPESDKKYIIE